MASKKGGKWKRSYYQAKLVTNIGTCVFCQRAVDDELIYGKLYAIGDIQCHYFCALLSCCLVQKGSDEEGLFGFLYPDILAEVERSKKHRCSYCNCEGASLGCSVSQCRKQFHLPCGRERDAVSLFYGNYKSFCAKHAPKQKIFDSIMPNVKMRIAEQRRLKQSKCPQQTQSMETGDCSTQDKGKLAETLCVICYEQVDGFPTTRTFWPPCCARDAWFHRSCLQRMALSAGMHYLKCPLCNDKDAFYKAVVSQGYYVPDRDAAWELEQNAFAEIYERPIFCSAEACQCPAGRDHDSNSGLWDIKLCILCGITAVHAGCTDNAEQNNSIYICIICKPAAPGDLEKLIASIEKVQLQEQAADTARHGPVMPCRMSLRRTKRRPIINGGPSCSQNLVQNKWEITPDNIKLETETSRLELNLKKPVRRIFEPTVKNIENTLLSPIKMLEQRFNEKIEQLRSDVVVDPSKILEKLREKLVKPRPLAAKKKIINNILEELFSSMRHDPKSKEALKEWNSPKKTSNVKFVDCEDIMKETKPTEENITEKGLFLDKESPLKSNSKNPILLQYSKIATEKESVFKNKDFKCNFKHKHIEMVPDGSKLRTAIDFAKDAYKENKRKLVEDETTPKKKRKFNCSLKRKNSTDKAIDLESKQCDFNVVTENTEINKIKEEGEVLRGSKEKCQEKIGLEQYKEDNTENKHSCVDKLTMNIDENKSINDAILEDNLVKDSHENPRELEMENNELVTIIETEGRTENKYTQNFKEETIELHDTNIEEDNDNKIRVIHRRIKPYEDALPNTIKNAINCRLKRKPTQTTFEIKDLEITNNKSDITETKDNLEPKMNTEIKATEGFNKDIKIKYIDEEVNKRKVGDKIRNDIIKRTKERNRRKIKKRHHSKKNKNDDKKYRKRSNNGRVLRSFEPQNDSIDLTVNDDDKKLSLKYKNNNNKRLSIQNKNIKVKIKWKKEQPKLKFTGKKEKKRILKAETPRMFKQYVLKSSPEVASPKEMIMKPDSDIVPVKRKYIKTEKQADGMVQTNISSFFRATPKFTT